MNRATFLYLDLPDRPASVASQPVKPNVNRESIVRVIVFTLTSIYLTTRDRVTHSLQRTLVTKCKVRAAQGCSRTEKKIYALYFLTPLPPSPFSE